MKKFLTALTAVFAVSSNAYGRDLKICGINIRKVEFVRASQSACETPKDFFNEFKNDPRIITKTCYKDGIFYGVAVAGGLAMVVDFTTGYNKCHRN